MGENLLSLVHIQKLGHPIEEIRQRALTSVVSKYTLNLVDESNLVNTKLLLENLLDWFDFENYSEEGRVLNLLLKILSYKNADLILKEIDRRTLLKRIKEIEKKVGCEYQHLIQDIVKHITETETVEDFYRDLDFPHTDRSELTNGNIPTEVYEFQKDFYVTSSRESKHTEENFQTEYTESAKTEEDAKHKLLFKVEYFPWQHLTPGDEHLLSGVYEKLRYIDNKSSILEGCQFFIEVLLRDFPVEVFIQRPLVVRTFLYLIESAEQDVRIPIVRCLIKTVQSLRKRIDEALNAALLNFKKEFYTTSVFPKMTDDESENLLHSNDEPDDSDFIDPIVKKYQVSVPQFCFEILLQIVSQLGRKHTQEESNLFLSLIYEALSCLVFNLNSDIWSHKDVRTQFYRFFVKLYEVLKYQKGQNRIVYVTLLYFTIKILNSIKPPSGVELSELLIAGLQAELCSCTSDYVLVLLFPQLHSEVYKYVQQLLGQKEKEAIHDHKEVSLVLESMKCSMRLSRSFESMKTRLEKLECFHAALPSLDFHQNFGLVQLFVNSCLLKWRKSRLKVEELKMRDKILIKLLAHCNDFVKICTYAEIHKHADKLLGVEEARTPRYEFPGNKMDFLFRTDILTEIICHGLNSPLPQVRKYSSDIISGLLKSKFIMSEACSNDFVGALIPCLGLLQCHADKASGLGRCIVRMFDPDKFGSAGLPPLEVLKGNMRFLFSKSSLMRDEAVSRLFWLLSVEDRENKKLPKMNVLTGLNLSGICCSVKPTQFGKDRHSFYTPDRLVDVLEMLDAEHVEPNLRRSALSQIAVMMDDFHLHPTFLEQDGLEKIVRILDNCLIEKEYRNYPDSVIPIADILKSLAYHNVCVRQELSSRADVMYNILRGLFLFSSDGKLRQDAVELICLLLYSDCILRVPSDVSAECAISFPDLVFNRMCLPFSTHVHWKNSRHLEPSVKKSVMSKTNSSKLIRASWAMEWVGGLSALLAIHPSEVQEKAFSPGIPDDMKISPDDLACLRNCAFGISVKQTLFDIQNATTHLAVFFSINKLQSYLLLYNVDRTTIGKKNSDVGSDTVLSHMLWESTLERFMTSHPSCGEDEALLLHVIRLVQLLLKTFQSDRLVGWIGKLLIDDHLPLMKLLKSAGEKNFGLVGKELRLALAELAEQTAILSPSLDGSKWISYLELICELLKADEKTEFYNTAYTDWFLGVLVHLTGNWTWDFRGRDSLLAKLLVRVMEVVVSFHCTKDSVVSFLGTTIVKNGLLALNYLACNAQDSVKDWEETLFQVLRKRADVQQEPNYSWTLSLFFMRDTTARAAALSLLTSLSTTPRACDLLLDLLEVPFDHLWCQTFRILFDDCESSFVRENAVLLLTNLTGHRIKNSSGDFLQYLQKIKFYQEVVKIISNYNPNYTLPGVRVHESVNRFSGHAVATPSFVSSVCALLTTIMALSPAEVSGSLLRNDVVEGLTTLLGDIPESASSCGEHGNSPEVLRMYTVACRILTKCVTASCYAHSYLIQLQHCINNLFAMINYSEGSRAMEAYKFELWYEILDLFTALLAEYSKCEKEENKQSVAFALLNKCMTDNGIDQFISSLYIAATSDDPALRSAVFRFLVNLFRMELATPKHVSISDVFDRKVSDDALKTAGANGWKGIRISETLTKSFGVRVADVLAQVFLLIADCAVQGLKMTVADCLGSLLAVCRPAQDFCVERGLPKALVSSLKEICVKLSLEKVENLKKPITRKKIEPLLLESETLFRLICNMTFGNEEAKSAFADCLLTTVVHKLWPWCMAKSPLQIVALKMLCTFTHSCDRACRALVGGVNIWGTKKSPGSPSLLNAVMNQVSMEMDMICNSHDFQALQLCLQLLTNSCSVADCRSLISKGNFLQCFNKLHPNSKKRSYGDVVVDAWLQFLVALSSHQDGQAAVAKHRDFLDVLTIKSTAPKSSHRIGALTVLRNVCFHQANRLRMLGSCEFLSLLMETLESKRGGEVQAATVAVWALSCNCQKAKLVLRSAGIEAKLSSARQRCILTEDEETAKLITVVLGILKNK